MIAKELTSSPSNIEFLLNVMHPYMEQDGIVGALHEDELNTEMSQQELVKALDVMNLLHAGYKNSKESNDPNNRLLDTLFERDRLMKMVFLTDWKSCLDRDKPVTDIPWRGWNYLANGSIININFLNREIHNLIPSDDTPSIQHTVFLAETDPSLEQEEKGVIQFVIDSTSSLPSNDFLDLYNGVTYFFDRQGTDGYVLPDILDLPMLARNYKKNVKEFLNASKIK